MSKKYHVYTDSSYKNGRCGIAYILTNKKESKVIAKGNKIIKCKSNNRGEMLAILFALESITNLDLQIDKLVIYSDNLWSINCLSGKWKIKKHKDIYYQIKEFEDKFMISYVWVKGHNGNKFNEECHYLASSIRGKKHVK